MCRRHGRLGHLTGGTAFERVDMSRIGVGVNIVVDFRHREICDVSRSRLSMR